MRKLKRTTKEVASYFEQHGCKLLGEYRGAQLKMPYECKCGEISEINWNHFSNGKRCGHCSKFGLKKKRSLQKVQDIFKERGCVFLDDSFQGIKHKHKYRCKCGRDSEITFAAFHFQKQDCKQCGLKKNKGAGHHQWNPDRAEMKLKKLIKKKCYKALQSSLKAIGQTKVGHTSDAIGYGPNELRTHIENHPNWTNVKNLDWDLDHIFPIAAFVEHGITDLKIINALDNLQPLLRFDNESKGASYDEKAFKDFLRSHGCGITLG
jgi:ribosomal protein L37E